MTIYQRLKTQINRLETYFSPMKKNVFQHRDGIIIVSFTDPKYTLTVECHVSNDIFETLLPLEEQTITIHFYESKTRHNEEVTKPMHLDEAKQLLKELNTQLAKTDFLLHRSNYTSSISIPKMRNMLFGVEYSEKDKNAFLNAFKPYIARHVKSNDSLNEMRQDYESDKALYEQKYQTHSKQALIDELKVELEKLEKEEQLLLQELEDEYALEAQKRDIQVKAENHKNLIQRYLFKAGEIIKENSFNLDFKFIEKLLK